MYSWMIKYNVDISVSETSGYWVNKVCSVHNKQPNFNKQEMSSGKCLQMCMLICLLLFSE